jgi:hypothetical protein
MTDEVLVHISTPATRQNDDLYRSLADAYLDFEPQRQHGEIPRGTFFGNDSSFLGQPTSNTGLDEEPRQSAAAGGGSILSTSKDSYGSFPSHVSSGGQPSTSQNKYESFPTGSRLARLDRIHTHWKEQITPKSTSNRGKEPARPTQRSNEYPNMAFIEDTQLGAQALLSQLQEDDYATTSEDTSDEDEEIEDPPVHNSRPLNSQRNVASQRIEVPSSIWPTPAAAARSINASQSRVQDTPASSVHAQVLEKQNIENYTDTLEVEYDFSTLPVDAYPPPPKISISCPNNLPSQITKQLAAIQIQNPERFRASQKSPTPKPDDRGYWSINPSSWPVGLQCEFWTSLREHVTSGRLGWSTTLYRDASSTHTLGKVRLYCWGEVVEHTWLLLWLCSKGSIVSSESRWIDADGTIVFEVARVSRF